LKSRKEYFRKYYKENREKRCAYMKQYRKRKKVSEYYKNYRKNNKEKLEAYNKEYWKRHPEKLKEMQKRTYKKNKHKYLKQMKERREKIRSKIFYLLGNKCCRCEFKDKRALQIDHVEGKGLKHMRTFSSSLSYYIQVLKEIKEGSKDYQCLCANCNWIKKREKKEI